MKSFVQKSWAWTDEWWSPKGILRLMRLIHQGDFLKLSEHPFSQSNTVQLYLSREGLNYSKYNTGWIIYDVVTSLLLRRLSEARLASRQDYEKAAEKELTTNGDALELDINFGRRELKCWSLLVYHYYRHVSIQKLSRYCNYSTRQVLYYLREGRNEFCKLLLEQENVQSVGRRILAPSKEITQLSPEDKESLLASLDIAYSAPCSTFLWGDWSALVSKKAIVVPVDKRVAVGIKDNPDSLSCRIYEWSQSEVSWILNERDSAKVTKVLHRSWQYLLSLIDMKPFDMYVFSDIHFGCGIHEASTMFLCLASCMIHSFPRGESLANRLEQLAAVMQSCWYPGVSGATITCSRRSPDRASVMIFDRTQDGAIDFGRIYENDSEELKRNRALSLDSLKATWLDLDVTKFAVVLQRFSTVDLSEIHKAYTPNLRLLSSIGFGRLCEIMEENILNLDYNKIGAMMNLHHSLLSACSFAPSAVDDFLERLRCIPKILGVKPSCSRVHGASIILVDGDPQEVTQQLPNYIQVVSHSVSPTPGIVELTSRSVVAGVEE
jgi:hypothetical protein